MSILLGDVQSTYRVVVLGTLEVGAARSQHDAPRRAWLSLGGHVAAQDNIPPMSAYMAITLSSNGHISAFQPTFSSFPYYAKLKLETWEHPVLSLWPLSAARFCHNAPKRCPAITRKKRRSTRSGTHLNSQTPSPIGPPSAILPP